MKMTHKEYVQNRKARQSHNRTVMFDIIMLLCTCGLWGFVMARRNRKARR